jgi:hypothetical protein
MGRLLKRSVDKLINNCLTLKNKNNVDNRDDYVRKSDIKKKNANQPGGLYQ